MRAFIQGFVPGLFVGAVVALLLTPRKGAETRAIVSQHIQDALEAGRQATQERAAELRARYRQATETSAEE